MFTILNGLSAARIAVVPVIVALVLYGHGDAASAAATGLFAAAAATDFLDGYLARRWRESTHLGTFLDTTADKLLVSGVVIALVSTGIASAWVAIVIVGRELLIMGLRGVAASGGIVVMPSIWGKLKANVQFVAILLALAGADAKVGSLTVAEWALWVAAAVTLASGLDYVVKLGGSFGNVDDR